MSQSVSGSQCKMAGVLNECTREEQRAAVRFLWAKGLSTEEVHREMHPMYGDNCLSRKAVCNWIQMLNKGRENIRDRERPGRPAEVSTEATVQRVEQIIRNDRRVTINDVARAVGCSHGTAYNIMHEQLKFRKICARWVPRQLSEEQKMNRMGLSLQHLNWYTEEGEDFMARIVTGDEKKTVEKGKKMSCYEEAMLQHQAAKIDEQREQIRRRKEMEEELHKDDVMPLCNTLKVIFQTPKSLSTAFLVDAWALLYANSDGSSLASSDGNSLWLTQLPSWKWSHESRL
ncbi:hypothetical protein J437_LFUL001693 [Ladona fulva]|uniref:Mos1 transposase HTH domain-containing protein n=1 Tax=Ladona fulva TaxID=123851 RepID=A0A8K0P0Y8_LADFU|nr:hypothetical protein J437_LFUL001693 [Ladona fulva]